MKKIKIAFIYDAIYPYIKGGGEKRYYEIANRLDKDKYEVHLYGMKLWNGKDVILKDGIYLHGISPKKNLYTKDGKRSIGQALTFGINTIKLFKEEFDVIDCCGFPYFSLFACKLVCLLRRKKLFSTWHEAWGKEYWKEYLGKLSIFGILIEKLAVHLPDEIISVSPQTAKKIKNELGFKKKISVIPNGIDFEYINKIKPSRVKSDVIYAGRLMDFKNIDILINSISILRNKKINIECIIIGDGPEREKLEKLSKNLGLTKNIQFKGFLKNTNQIYSYFKSSKVFVLPSTREGFGIVALEANACGIPVITVDHKNNASKELITKNNGLITKTNKYSIAGTIIKLLNRSNNSEEIKNITKQFDWVNTINKVSEVYNL